jgi:hypothetical protein
MLDSGLPLATETNILKELIKPPNIFRKVANLVTGDNTKYVNKLFSYAFNFSAKGKRKWTIELNLFF